MYKQFYIHNSTFRQQLNNLREQLSTEASRHRELVETTNCRLRSEEIQKSTIEERFEKAQQELQQLKSDSITVMFTAKIPRKIVHLEVEFPFSRCPIT